MTFQLAIALFGLLSILLIGTEIMYTYATQGIGFGFSSNRPIVQKTPLGLRIERTYKNHVEAASYILPAFLLGAFAGVTSPGLETAALIVILGRALFSALFITGYPFIRVPAFVMGTFGSLYILITVAMNL